MLTNCVIHYDKDAYMGMSKRGFVCHCHIQVCSVLRSLFLRVGAVYGISNLTNGVDHHGEVGITLCNVYPLCPNSGGECGLLMQKRDDN